MNVLLIAEVLYFEFKQPYEIEEIDIVILYQYREKMKLGKVIVILDYSTTF